MNKLAAITMALLLASCSDESNENLTLPKDLHTNEREIAATAEFDAQVEERSADGWAMGTELFQTETELLIRGQQPVSALRIRATDTPTLRKAYFGDLHVHTANSFDAFTIGTLATPHDAYRYAKGEAISHPAGFDMQMSRPLDFYAVTDHAMF